MPKILYKYRDYCKDTNRKTLFDFELFLASTPMFNDPYEGTIPFSYDPQDLTPENIFLKMRELAYAKNPEWSESQIQSYCFEGQQKNLLHDEDFREKFDESIREKIENDFGIISLAPNPFNYLMWSHYANCHKGFCIGFDRDILNETVQGSLGPVNYDNDIPKFRLFEDIPDFLIKLLGTKSKVWEYEEEYRIIKMNASKQIIKYPKEMIKEIFLGCKMELKNRKEIIDFVKKNSIECQIIETSLNKEKFMLDTLRIY